LFQPKTFQQQTTTTSNFKPQTTDQFQYKKGPNPQNFKVAKCKYWEKDSTCRYGSLCTFAHGDSEVRKSNYSSDNMNYMNSMNSMNQMNPMQNFGLCPDPNMFMPQMPFYPMIYDPMMFNYDPNFMPGMNNIQMYPTMPAAPIFQNSNNQQQVISTKAGSNI
jgi:hypothetical protein